MVYHSKRAHHRREDLKAMANMKPGKVTFTADDTSESEQGVWRPTGKWYWEYWEKYSAPDKKVRQPSHDTRKRKREDQAEGSIVQDNTGQSHEQAAADEDVEEVVESQTTTDAECSDEEHNVEGSR